MLESDLTNAIAVSLGPTIAVAVGAVINWKAASRAKRAALNAQLATARAAETAAQAQQSASVAARQAADSARALVEAAKGSNERLDRIADTATETHKIVNNQRTVMLNLVAKLSRRVADDNPHDQAAQRDATLAEQDAAASR